MFDDLRLRLTSPYAHTVTVSPWGFEMECEYEYDEGESPVMWPTERAHPGSPPNVQLLSCRVGGVEIFDYIQNPWLSEKQIERIEELILRHIE